MSQPTIRQYSLAVKKHVVEEIEAGRMSVAEAWRRYDISGSSTIYRWLCQFCRHPRSAPTSVDVCNVVKLDSARTGLQETGGNGPVSHVGMPLRPS